MPSNRRLKATALIAILTVLIILYVSNGAKSTVESPFYTRTVAAIQNRHDAEGREAVIAEEQARQARVAKIQQEHDKAMETKTPNAAAAAAAAAGGNSKAKQQPIVEDVKEAAAKATAKAGEGVKKAQDAATSLAENAKTVAGRKKMDGGKVVINGKSDENDGVAKVGNTGPKESSVVKSGSDDDGPKSEEDHKVEEEMNSILKKGPVIIFSKSYCPFSMKAKHILLDLYTITPPPYVVELDLHDHGAGLQAALHKSTGRKTVPNVLVNGRSIGGGDDVQALHESDKLAETVQAMGGKRVMEMKKKPAESGGGEGKKEREVKFRA